MPPNALKLKERGSEMGMLSGTNGLRKGMAKEANLAEIILDECPRPKINYDKCKVIVTIGGPLTETVDQLAEMLQAGMTVARFDFTSGSRTLEQHVQTLENLRAAQKRTRCLCAIYCALGGNIFAVSKADPKKDLVFTQGQTVKLVHGEPVCESSDVLPLDSSVGELDFNETFSPGDVVHVHPFLRAGELTAELEVTSVSDREIVCTCRSDVEVPSTIKRLAVNFSGAKNAPPFNACDEVIVQKFAVPSNVDFISVGAVRDGGMLGLLKQHARSSGLPSVRIIAQIDNLHALRDLPGILRQADVVLLARGELGAVVASEKMFAVQKHVLKMCEKVGRPCIVTRLMDSMIFAPRPTRAEATDVANIVLDGADGLLLGLETLDGNFPLACLETVLSIAREADSVYDYEARYRRQMVQMNVKLAKATDSLPWGVAPLVKDDPDLAKIKPNARRNSLTIRLEQFEVDVNLKKEALAAAAVQTAYQIEAKLIVVFSHTGETTRLVAKYHPQCPVLSLSIPTVHGGTVQWRVEGDVEARQQLVYRGVVPALSVGSTPTLDDDTAPVVHQAGATRTDVEALTKAQELGLIVPDDLAVFCQLIAGLSTVKVVEFAGMRKPKSRTFSPEHSRSSSPGVPQMASDDSLDTKDMKEIQARFGRIGTHGNFEELKQTDEPNKSKPGLVQRNGGKSAAKPPRSSPSSSSLRDGASSSASLPRVDSGVSGVNGDSPEGRTGTARPKKTKSAHFIPF